ncbi:MAG: CPBP family intramembrane metalloprotease [Lachnospiraceae bacterium]|nr:CPBP family intramembrane metalloprotease [Lachnospiraceae bacterium]
MKQFLKKVSPFNNSTKMPVSLFIIKKILAFWVCYITGLFIAEEMLCRGIVLHALKEKTSFLTAVIVSTILFILECYFV